MVDVFISYSRSHQPAVARLARAVADEGYSVWWDEELPPHRSYGDVITEKITEAKAAVVVWSESAAASEWVRAEADLARNQKKLIQASLDGRMPPMPFNQIQFAAIGDWNGEPDHPGWRKIKASLDALCGPRDGAVPAPERTRPEPAAPAPARGGRSAALIAGVLAALLLGAAAAFWISRDRPSERSVSPPAGQPMPAMAKGPRGHRASGSERFTHQAVIDDPDGYTNLRSAPSVQAAILARVEEGEEFATFPQRGRWWQVRLADGRIGYMAASRIRLVRPPGASGER